MNICLASDRNYLHYLYITIASILKSSLKDEEINIFILQSDFDTNARSILNRLKKTRNFNLEFIDIDETQLSDCKLEGYHLPLQTYYRYLIADLKPELDKIIYLDVDTEVCGSLSELWNIDLHDNIIGAVRDSWCLHNDSSIKTKIGHDDDDLYFNAGILLLNLEAFRRLRLKDTLIYTSIINRDIFSWGDQDALNQVCRKRVKEVSPIYNFQTEDYIRYQNGELKHIGDNFIIRHYCGKDKNLNKLFPYLDGFPFIEKNKKRISYLISFYYTKFRRDRKYLVMLRIIRRIPLVGYTLKVVKDFIFWKR
jgi:lipopolysaccharide biosynthesis glycosyltransferase